MSVIKEFEEFVTILGMLGIAELKEEKEEPKIHKVINTRYDKTYHKFTQEIVENGEITSKTDTFSRPAMNQKVIVNEPAVICILDDGSKGVSKCMEEDVFDENKGIKIAYIKAKIKSLQKELKQLSK
mgnify:CR=1 FL=1